MPYRCEQCGRIWDDQSAAANDYFCLRSCNGKLLPLFPRERRLVSLVPKLPSTLAIMLNEYIHEENDYLALHSICGTLEIVTRFLTLIVLAEFWNRPTSPDIPEALQSALVQYLDLPTLGSWRELLKAAVADLPGKKGKKECMLPELNSYEVRLRRELGFNNHQPLEKLLPMRNLVAHGGRLSDETVRELLAAHKERFEELMEGLSFLSVDEGVQLVASPDEGVARLLCGVPFAAVGEGHLDFQEYDRSQLPETFRQAGPDRMLLITPRGVLDLCPLNSYGEVFHVVKNELKGMDEDAMHIYSRKAESGGREYSALGSKASYSRGNRALEKRFDEIFHLEIWRSRYRKDTALEKFGFNWRMDELTNLFVGRDDLVMTAVERIKATASGVLWLPGKPGMGKSAFMAKLVRSFQESGVGDPAERVICIPYFFQISESHLCRTSAFAEAAIWRLSRALGRNIRLESDPNRLVDQFRGLLTEDALAQAGKVIFFLDGMDEITRVDSGFLDLIFTCQQQNVLWVCAGRDEYFLCERFSRDRCQWLLESADGLLPSLVADEVRAFFIEELGHRLPQFFARDTRQADGTWSNGFVEEVLKQSECLPLYLKLLVQDIRSGKFDFSKESERRLPNGLEEYYDRIVEEMGNDLSATVPAVTGLLAVTKEPLPFEALAELLADHEYVRKGGPDFLHKTIRHSNIMLSQAPTTRGALGYKLSHESYREHVLKCKDLEVTVNLAVDRFCSLAARWRNLEEGSHLLNYALRYSAAHLAGAGKGEELWQLLRDEDYRKKQVELLKQYAPAFLGLEEGIKFYIGRNGETLDDDARLCWLVLRAGELGQAARSNIRTAFEWAKHRPLDDSQRIDDVLDSLKVLTDASFFNAIDYLLWIEATRQSHLPQEARNSGGMHKILDAAIERIPDGEKTLERNVSTTLRHLV